MTSFCPFVCVFSVKNHEKRDVIPSHDGLKFIWNATGLMTYMHELIEYVQNSVHSQVSSGINMYCTSTGLGRARDLSKVRNQNPFRFLQRFLEESGFSLIRLMCFPFFFFFFLRINLDSHNSTG